MLDPDRHQHATEIITEQGTHLEFDLEVPIEQWINTSLQSIVPCDLVTKSMEDVDQRIHVHAHSSYVDGLESKSWDDSALAGAASATVLRVREVHTFKNGEEVPGATWQGVDVNLDASPAIYDAIEHRLTELFGKPDRAAKTNAPTWKRSRLVLTHSPAGSGLKHIGLSWDR